MAVTFTAPIAPDHQTSKNLKKAAMIKEKNLTTVPGDKSEQAGKRNTVRSNS